MTQPAPDPAALRAALIDSPTLCPLEWNADRTALLFGRLSEAEYRATSFLDRRAVQPGTVTGVVPWSLAEPWLLALPRQCDFLFHISHCGSTLLSRLLGETDQLFAIREPGVLRGLTVADPDARLQAVLGLLSRRFHARQKPIVKATSVVNAVAARLMDQVPESRAIAIQIPAASFLAAVLDGSQSDIAAHAADRSRRLSELGLVDAAPPPTTPGEQAAAAWLCEMATLQSLADRHPGRVAWLDFEAFLERPEPVFQAACDHLEITTDAAAIVRGPLMDRYAKRTDVAYDASFRRNLLDAAGRRFASDITAGLAWLQRHLPPGLVHDSGL